MSKLKFSFAFKDRKFYLCCTVQGTTKRHYKDLWGEFKLVNPNFAYWDSKAQRFMEPSVEAIENNTRLQKMLVHYTGLYDTYSSVMDIPDGKALFALEGAENIRKDHKEKSMTFGEFIQSVIDTSKHSSCKKPSKSYQRFITLKHKLEMEGIIINKPLKSICNSDFISFGQFILKKLSVESGRNNYLNLMKLFKNIHTQAFNKELNDNILRYPYVKEAPVKNSHIKVALTRKQYGKFCSMSLSDIPQGGVKRSFYKELYRDFCIFLYEMKMRPCDVIKLHSKDLQGGYVIYTAEKKKNYLEERKRVTKAPLTDKAREIICKYKGMSQGGYIFPFALNNYNWDFNDSISWNKWSNRKQKVLEDINCFLHKCEDLLGVSPITVYTFRHTSFTHAVDTKECNLLKLAKEGATSVKMLEGYYYHT